MVRLYNKTVGILDKNRTHTTGKPVHGCIKGLGIQLFIVFSSFTKLGSKDTAGFVGHLPQHLNAPVNRINILFNMVNRTYGKTGSLVNGTERTAIPGTVACDTDEQAVCLTGRSYGPLFESRIFFACFMPVTHKFTTHLSLFTNLYVK
jgi:hypothetical protein